MKYLLEAPINGIIGNEKYTSSIHWRNGVLTTDEPEKLGGKDLGPDPFTLLLSSLVACTLSTLKMYIDHKELAIAEISIEANMFYRIENGEVGTRIERKIAFQQTLAPDVEQRLLEVADSCPVSKILKGNISVLTELKK
jgi:putative redox protein